MQTQFSKRILTASAAVLCAFLVPTARADSFGNGGNAFTLEFVNIGNADNANDAGAGGGLYSSPYGEVPYAYRMGTFEIAQDAITKATASGVLNLGGGAWSATQSAASMTWFQAAAFVNYLNTSTGRPAAYQLDLGNTTLTLWSSGSSGQAWQAGGENLYRNKDAYYFLPNENEWHKAAYHQNTGVNADYWDYATGSNTAPREVSSGIIAGTAVYNGVAGSPAAVNNAGGLSAYGTMGQNGNVFEWTESAFDGSNNSSSKYRAIRGGSWIRNESVLRSSFRNSSSPTLSYDDIGFRVASVPEPSSTVLVISAGLLALARRRRRAAL